MSAKAIREATGKDILNRLLDSSAGAAKCQFAAVSSETNWDHLRTAHPWLETTVCNNLCYIFNCFYIFFCYHFEVELLDFSCEQNAKIIFIIGTINGKTKKKKKAQFASFIFISKPNRI